MRGNRIAFPEIATESLRDKVIAALKEAFFARTLRAGDPIVERHLASEMGVGTPAIREALVTLQEQGFVRRVANTGTYVNKFSIDEVEQMFRLRIEIELLAFQWGKRRVVESDLQELEQIVEQITGAAAEKKSRQFYELDLEFHRRCWALCGNKFLARALETLVAPLFAFVLNASMDTVDVAIAREHLNLTNALRSLEEPEFSAVVRRTLSGFAMSAMKTMHRESPTGEQP